MQRPRAQAKWLPPLPHFKHADLVSGSRHARKSLARVACAPCDDLMAWPPAAARQASRLRRVRAQRRRYFLIHYLRRQLLANAAIAASRVAAYDALNGLSERAVCLSDMITWTLVIFVYSGAGTMIQSSITGYSSFAECNKAGSNWMKNERHSMKEYRCVSLKIDSGPRR